MFSAAGLMIGLQSAAAIAPSFARRLALGASGLGVIVAFWWVASLGTDALRIPSPDAVLRAIGENFWDIPELSYIVFQQTGLIDGLVYTFTNVMLGVALGASLGFVTGLLLARVDLVRQVLEPPLIIFGTVPILIVLPFLVLWFGTSRLAQAGLVIFYSMLTVTFVTQQAARNVGRVFEQYAASLGASRRRLFFEIILPASIPEAIGGLRVAFAAGWGFEAIAEILGAQRGTGRIIQVFGTLDATADMMAVVLCITALGVVVDAAVVLATRWVVRWQE